jgi:NTP pyrophosphatase (non-canonical NTP hydrolase)
MEEQTEKDIDALRGMIDKQTKEIIELKTFNPIFYEIQIEVSNAIANWPPFNSAHEGFAILMEEVDELWQHVKTNQKKRDLEKMRREAIQVAAMAFRFLTEVCTEERGRK